MTDTYLVKAHVTVVCKSEDEKIVIHTFKNASVNISVTDFKKGVPFMHGAVSLYELDTWGLECPNGNIPVCIKHVKILSVENLDNF